MVTVDLNNPDYRPTFTIIIRVITANFTQCSCFRSFFSISLYQFLQLIIYYYGGHDSTIRKISEHRVMGKLQLDE